MASSIPFNNPKRMFGCYKFRSLVFGSTGLLAVEEDTYFKDLKRYAYLAHKYQLEISNNGQLQFFKHRPDNFQP
jgi:hypothetical protein